MPPSPRWRSSPRVAPLAGAWIETSARAGTTDWRTSPPSRGRGSKPPRPWSPRRRPGRPPRGGVDRNVGAADWARWFACRPPRGGVDRNPAKRGRRSTCPRRPPRGGVDRNEDEVAAMAEDRVAPLAGAWIETARCPWGRVPLAVAPLAGAWIETGSSGARMSAAAVAPLAGAWIETATGRSSTRIGGCRPPRGGVDRNCSPSNWNWSRARRPPRGGVDRNGHVMAQKRWSAGRPPRGGVDRNSISPPELTKPSVAPLAGAWIETDPRAAASSRRWSPPSRGRGSKPGHQRPQARGPRRPPRGGVDRNRYIDTSRPCPTCRPPRGGVDRNGRKGAVLMK